MSEEYGPNDNPVLYVESLEEKIKELEVSISQLKYAIRQTTRTDTGCKHLHTSYNGEASWCLDCKRITLIEDIADELKKTWLYEHK